MNDSKITLDKLIDNNISTKENQETYQSRKTKPDTIVTYVCGNCKNPKRVHNYQTEMDNNINIMINKSRK